MSTNDSARVRKLKLQLAAACRDPRVDAALKNKLAAIAGELGLAWTEVEGLAERAGEPGRPVAFEPQGLFLAACSLAVEDGLLTRGESQHLYRLKEALQLPDEFYRQAMEKLASLCREGEDATDAGDPPPGDEPPLTDPAPLIRTIVANVEKVIVGKRQVIERVLTCALANSHVLLEDVPGTGKTVLARALSASLDCTFKRVQFTPDLLPMDLTGTMVFQPQSSTFSFKRGPVFTNILIADEVNRATPRTQSSLLEVMEERQVSMDGVTYPLPPVFFVLATQNPIEQHGTYPLPEAQLDRFLMKLSMGYPDGASERTMLEAHLRGNPVTAIRSVVKKPQFLALQRFVREKVTVSRELQEYILGLTTSLRSHKELTVGPSPRASIALMRAAMAFACVEGRDFVIPDDVKTLAASVLAHRLVLHPKALIKHVRPEELVEATVKQLSVPTGR